MPLPKDPACHNEDQAPLWQVRPDTAREIKEVAKSEGVGREKVRLVTVKSTRICVKNYTEFSPLKSKKGRQQSIFPFETRF